MTLIISLAVMAVLIILAVSFARLMNLERYAARRLVEEVEARFAAEAGVERAVAAIRDQMRDGAYVEPDPPWASDDPPGTPIEASVQPSFAAGTLPDGLGAFSGRVEDDVDGRDSYYVVRVTDSSRMIHINSRYSESPPPDGIPVLARMLANLAKAIDAASPPISLDDAVAILNYRDAILPARNLPPRFANRVSLIDALVETGRMTAGQAAAAVASLWDYVTCTAWPQAALDGSGNLLDPSDASYPAGFDRYPMTRPLNRPERPQAGQSIFKRDDPSSRTARSCRRRDPPST
ncbi:MAG: pilus assembly PilX N-terminal domain-containing protein [Planctomycetes bacterium]|nr:pilus assembly PilX N-terminal domain-containing protein [Planctomycetota bacterium]